MNPDSSWRDTPATRLFGIEMPIVLGPFGGLSSVKLTAAVSEAGGLGSYGLYGYDYDRITTTARDLARATSKPFALNLWLPHEESDETRPDEETFGHYLDVLRPYFDELEVEFPLRPAAYLPPFDEQLAAALEARPAVLSFVFGIPSAQVLDAARGLCILTVGTATTVDEAIALDSAGVDAIVATGMEAGGHRVSFLRKPEDSLVGTFALVPQVADAVSVPVIAAGGIADGRGVAAAINLGAHAVQIGTAFLATEESEAAPVHRAAIGSEGAGHTVLTKALSGRLARGSRTASRATSKTRIESHRFLCRTGSPDVSVPRPQTAESEISCLCGRARERLWSGMGAPVR